MASREDLVEVFDDTEYWCKHDEKLEAAIMDSILWQRPTRRFLQNLMACLGKCILRCTAVPAIRLITMYLRKCWDKEKGHVNITR